MNEHVADWLRTHPVLFQYLIWPALTALVLAIFKSRTPEQYAALAARNPQWLFSRWAGFLILLSGAGFDSAKVLEGLRRVLTGYAQSVDEAAARELLEKVSIRPPAPDSLTATTLPPTSQQPPKDLS